MTELFRAKGYEIAPYTEHADIVVVNTCTVTGTGDKKSLQAIRRAARSGAYVIVGGCLAQKTAVEIMKMEGVRVVIGTSRRKDVVELFERALSDGGIVNAVDELTEVTFEPLEVTAHEGKRKAVLKIQEGCDNRCSYCVIPSVRGRARSSPFDKVIADAEKLAMSGYRHIVLTGIHLMSYGKDLPGNNKDLADVVQAVALIGGVEHVSLGSLEPPLSEGFIVRLKNKKLVPKFHVSAQSGSTSVLARMRRKYTAQQYRAMVTALREHFDNAAITTDIMVGFPGETNTEFDETLAFVKEIGFEHIHVFPYSPRDGTEAAKMEQVPFDVVMRRKRILLDL